MSNINIIDTLTTEYFRDLNNERSASLTNGKYNNNSMAMEEKRTSLTSVAIVPQHHIQQTTHSSRESAPPECKYFSAH